MLSAQRSFVRRVDVVDMGNPNKGSKGDPISIFLFSDSMEVRVVVYYMYICAHYSIPIQLLMCTLHVPVLQVAKRRAATGFPLRNSVTKIFKHLEFIPLIHVRSVVQFRDSDGGGECL